MDQSVSLDNEGSFYRIDGSISLIKLVSRRQKLMIIN